MAALESMESQYLEKHGSSYRVTYPVPKELQKRLKKKRLKKSLGTGDLRKANKLKIQVLAKFGEIIELERCAIKLEKRAVVQERGTALERAKQLRATLADPNLDAEGRRSAETEISIAYGGFLGKPIDYEYAYYDDDAEVVAFPIYDPVRQANAHTFMTNIYPDVENKLDALHEEWLATIKQNLTRRTKDDDRRALRFWKDWCRNHNLTLEVSKFSQVHAYEFFTELKTDTSGLQAVTRAKYLNRLLVFWKHLVGKGWAHQNVWEGKRIEIPQKSEERLERAFKQTEVRKLLYGGASQKLLDVIMIGLLTGARLDAIICLKVEDIKPDRIKFGMKKKEIRDRFVPIHPFLKPILERRIAHRQPGDDLFPDWPKPQKKDSLRERSFQVSKAFTAYRKKCGVDEVYPGDRRSKVNFHSFRRWFISQMRMDAPLDMVRALVGHSQGNVTDGNYRWTGPRFSDAVRYISHLPIPADNDDELEELDGVNIYDTELALKGRRQRPA